MKKENVNLIRDAAVTVVLTFVLLLGACYVPVVALVLLLCSGVPLAVFAARNEIKITLLLFLLSAIPIALMTGDWADTGATMIIGVLPGVIMGYMLGKKSNFYSVLIAGCTVVCLGWILDFLLLERLHEIKIDQVIMSSIAESGNAMKTAFAQAVASGVDFGGTDIISMVDIVTEQVYLQIMVHFPGIIVVLSIIMGYIMLRVSGLAIRRVKMADVDIVPFSMMKVPRSMCWVIVLAYLVHTFATPLESWWVVSANVVLVLQVIMAFSGLSCVDYWFGKVIRHVALRVLIYIAAFMVMLLLVDLLIGALVIVAILDSSRDFRKIETQQ